MRTPVSATLRRLVVGAGVLLAAAMVSARAEAQELRDQYHQAARDTVSQEVYDGWKQFNLNCARCYGEDCTGYHDRPAPHRVIEG